MIRDLFRTSSCSSSESSAAASEESSNNSTDQLNDENNTPVPTTTTTQFEVDGVLLSRDQQCGVGLEIHEKLWPAASKLANFVLEQYDSSTLDNDDDDDDGEKEEEEIHVHNVVRRMHEIQRKECALNKLKNMLRNTNEQNPLMIIELGAGVGLTGIKICKHIHAKALLTDLEFSLPILSKNIQLNKKDFILGEDSTMEKKLDWSNYREDCESALSTLFLNNNKNNNNPEKNYSLLILAADCVYNPDYHLALEHTIATLLSLYHTDYSDSIRSTTEGEKGNKNESEESNTSSSSSSSSICLIAGQRRWKTDNTFYNKLGKKSMTSTHKLECVCLKESITYEGDDDEKEESSGRKKRLLHRIYAVQWNKNVKERK